MTQSTLIPQFGFGSPVSYAGVTTGMLTTDFYDNRTNVTSADSAAIALHVVPAAGRLYNVDAMIVGYTGTVSSGKYVVGWTVNTAAFTATISITAVGGSANTTLLIGPDSLSTVTVQLTTLTGGLAAVNVGCILSRVL